MELDQDLLKRLRKIGVPLVLHGASGVTEEAIRTATRNGLRKININTALKGAAVRRIRERLGEDPDCDLLDLLEKGRDGVRALAVHYMKLFGSAGRLKDCAAVADTLSEDMLQGE